MAEISSFLTNIGLITSNGPHGQNIMSCEWTYQISYTPHLIAICIRKTRATAQNIMVSKEFGVSIAAIDQNVVSSISGNHHGHEIDKIAVLKELGVTFYIAKKIDVLMVKGASANMECKLVTFVDIGDQPIFIGEVVQLSENDTEPIVYHQGKYFKIGENIPKPNAERLEAIGKLIRQHIK